VDVSLVVRSGRPHPLGATFDGRGVNFAVFSQNGTGVELCLFDERGSETRIPLRAGVAQVWHAYVEGALPGQRYGFRVHGPYDPRAGHRFNPHKLLGDPYGRAFTGKVDYRAPVHGWTRRALDEDTLPDPRDDAWGVPKSVVEHDDFDWAGDHAPEVPWSDTVLYEVHVKSFTRLHHGVPSALRGTYGGVASEAAIAHLRSIGVTSVELLPVHECVDEAPLFARGMINYWGYSTLGFFAPEQRYASRPGAQVTEFKQMVKGLHAAGIEVVLDVVYNHTCEGDRLGPTLMLRGLDNAAYYRLKKDDPSVYEDYSGCGNALNVASPQVLKLMMDSLRYWVTTMHVDGFRFDLASALARDTEHVDKLSAFFDIIHQDPILSRVKLIAEPWDLGEGGYQVGNFPVLWNEWNGRYRDTVRRFWTGDASRVGDLGFRLTGSSDLYQDDGRHPHASINFVTAHDGFTLRDLVSYERKHNEANGEANQDGGDDNASANLGVEGETDDATINALRARQQRNFLTTLFLSQGVPMLASGDEIGKTQHGNNNAYVQDNPTSWLDWELDPGKRDLLAFTRRLAELRRAHPVFRRRGFLHGEKVGESALRDVTWLTPEGREMSGDDWHAAARPALGMLLGGDAIGWTDLAADGMNVPVMDDSFLLFFNADAGPLSFHIPESAARASHAWEAVVDTAEPDCEGPPGGSRSPENGEGLGSARIFHPGDLVPVLGRSIVVLRGPREARAGGR
jgi:isoamylase